MTGLGPVTHAFSSMETMKAWMGGPARPKDERRLNRSAAWLPLTPAAAATSPAQGRAHHLGEIGGFHRHGIAAGRRVLDRLCRHLVDAVFLDAEPGERVRHAELLAQLQHPVEEGRRSRGLLGRDRRQAAAILLLDGLAVEAPARRA